MTTTAATDGASPADAPTPFVAIVLGAGRGTRLGPLTESLPKILAPVAALPLLEHQLRYLEGHGASEVAINAHHLAEQVTSFVRERRDGPPVRVSFEPELLGTAGALLPLRDLLTDTFVVLYGDVLTDVDLQALLRAHAHHGGIATIVYTEAREVRDKGLLLLDDRGRVVSFAEKPDVSPPTAFVSAGVYALEPAILDYVSVGADFGFDVFPTALAARARIYGFRHDGYLRDVGSASALAGADRDIAARVPRW